MKPITMLLAAFALGCGEQVDVISPTCDDVGEPCEIPADIEEARSWVYALAPCIAPTEEKHGNGWEWYCPRGVWMVSYTPGRWRITDDEGWPFECNAPSKVWLDLLDRCTIYSSPNP